MRISELFEDSEETLKLRVDNPKGQWLKDKREDNEQSKPNQFGGPSRFGPVTGAWNRHVLLPVDLVAAVRGVNDEQSRVRKDSFDYLHKTMGVTKKLPLLDSGKQYSPFIMVDMNGKAWVSEGNHRIMVAKKLGWKYIPIELRYFTGGEEVAGKFSPDKVKKFDAEAHLTGLSVLNFSQA